ncbi:MAG: ATP-grasp fold amidoligase family protein [Bacteroidota bacterium]
MIETSALIAESFKFVRVDFYVQNNKLIIGECTFFPEGGMGLFDTRIQDEQIGEMFVNN